MCGFFFLRYFCSFLSSIFPFLCFSRCLSSSFWVTTRHCTEILKEPLNQKQQIFKPCREINYKITKYGKILEYFFNFNIVFPENETVNFVFSCKTFYQDDCIIKVFLFCSILHFFTSLFQVSYIIYCMICRNESAFICWKYEFK